MRSPNMLLVKEWLGKEWVGSSQDSSNKDGTLFIKYENLLDSFGQKYEQNKLRDQSSIYNRLYNVNFCYRIEKTIINLVNPACLPYDERLILIACGWLFYCGYVLNDNSKSTKRVRFDEKIAMDVLSGAQKFRFEKKTILRICKHASPKEINSLEKGINNDRHWERLIAASLLLAETFNEEISEGEDGERTPDLTTAGDLFTEIIPINNVQKEEEYLHWLKRNVTSVKPDFPSTQDIHTFDVPGVEEKKRIYDVTVYNIKPEFEPKKNTDLNRERIIEKTLFSYFENKLYTIRKVLIAYFRQTKGQERKNILEIFNSEKVNVYSGYVLFKYDPDATTEPGDQDKHKTIKLIASFIKHKKASAGKLAEDIVNIILKIIQREKSSPSEKIGLLQEFSKNVLEKILKDKRPCHIILHKISHIIKAPTKDNLVRIENSLSEFINSREKILDRIYEFAKPLLIRSDSILLFGYSSTILHSLRRMFEEAFDTDKDSLWSENGFQDKKIYVAIASNKNRFNVKGQFEYCDGIKYAHELKNISKNGLNNGSVGFKNVFLVPDITIGSLMNVDEKGNTSASHFDAVLLGSNGIDLEKRTFGHTAGHATIVKMAALHKIPVYILADTWKIKRKSISPKEEQGTSPNQEAEQDDIQQKTTLRETQWLPVDLIAPLKLGEKDKDILYNLREDLVSIDSREGTDLRLLVSDAGVFFFSKVPDDIARDFEYDPMTEKENEDSD